MLRITVLTGGDEEQVLTFGQALVSLGTAPDSQIVLPDRFVSRRHGQFILAGGRWRYRDLGSRNGSSIERGGALVAVRPGEPDVVIESGDVLVVGQTRLRLEVTEAMPAGGGRASRSRCRWRRSDRGLLRARHIKRGQAASGLLCARVLRAEAEGEH